jgi:probable addiction module antidote protein
MASRNVRATHNKHLRDPEVATEYLNDAIESGDKSVVLMAIRNIAEAQPDGIAGLAARAGLGRESMYKMLSSAGNPKLDSFMRLMRGLGLRIRIEPEQRADNQNNHTVVP